MTSVDTLARREIARLLKKVTPGQRKMFYKMYGSIAEVPRDRLDWAILQCQRTIDKNIDKNWLKRVARDLKSKFKKEADSIKKQITKII